MMGRHLTAACLALGCLAATAAPAQACKLFGCGRPTTTFYAPVAAAPVMPVVAQPQVVSYMPQTAFRTVIVNRPVVTMMPQTACDPCGRATTVMRPVTSFVSQPQLVPYTTFRPVVTSVAQPCCAASPVTVSFAPAAAAAPACCGATPTPTLSGYAPAPAPAPACCGTTPTPTLSSYSPAPTTLVQPSTTITQNATPVPSLQPGAPGSTVPSLSPVPDPSINGGSYQSTTPQSQTFAPNGNGAIQNNGSNGNHGSTNGSTHDATNGYGTEAQPQSRVLLPPYNNNAASPNTSSLLERPRGLDPEDSDRTTAIPLRSSIVVRQASLVVPVETAPTKSLDDSGWEAN